MKTVFYKKQGRRYLPVSEYDSEYCDSYPKGSHLVVSKPGSTMRMFNIEPALAPMIAAGRVAEDAICRAINKASEMRPARTPITPAQQRAWKNLAKEFGDELCTLNGSSTRDIAEAGVEAMQQEADKLLKNDAVRLAYDQFMLVCRLTQTQTKHK